MKKLNMQNTSFGKYIGAIVLATRPWSFSMTVISITLGSLLASPAYEFHWGHYALALIGSILAHAGANVLNDYFDFRHGLDVAGAPTTLYRKHPLVEREFTPEFLLGLSVTCYLLASAIGLYFILSHGWIIALFALLGGFTGVFYTAGPIQYKHYALGEIAVFLMWGPLMISASYFIQIGSFERIVPVLLVSIPQGLWVALVLLANNLKDIDYDSQSAINTLGTFLGRKKAIRFFSALVILIYGATGAEILAGIIPLWGLLTGCSLPIIVRLITRFQREERIPHDADPQTAQTGMVYGVLLIIAFLLTRIF